MTPSLKYFWKNCPNPGAPNFPDFGEWNCPSSSRNFTKSVLGHSFQGCQRMVRDIFGYERMNVMWCSCNLQWYRQVIISHNRIPVSTYINFFIQIIKMAHEILDQQLSCPRYEYLDYMRSSFWTSQCLSNVKCICQQSSISTGRINHGQRCRQCRRWP